MTTKVEQQIEELKQKLDAMSNSGATINVIPGEGSGKSSCIVSRGAKGGMSYEVKVYSNDRLGAAEVVNEALQQSRRIEHELKLNGEGLHVPREDES